MLFFALLLHLSPSASGATVRETYPPPLGAQRIEGDAFGRWLGTLPLAPVDEPVRTWSGQVVPQDARVIDLPLVPGDLQQCADTILRLRAEWLREQGLTVSFFATSGDAIPWARWMQGERPRAEGRGLVWSTGGSRGDSPASWERYLAAVFTWAGTRSLAAYETVPTDQPRPGDVIVQGGSPGHAVLVLDAARRPDGEQLILIGEGFMPAQSAHVQHGPVEDWWVWDPEEGLDLPYWPLPASALRRFKD